MAQAAQVLTNARILMGEYDATGQVNTVSLDYGVQPIDATTFGSGGTKEAKGGLKLVTFRAGGFVVEATGSIGDYGFTRVGTADVPLTLIPQGGAADDIAFFFKSMATKYAQPFKLGQLQAFTIDSEPSNGPLVRGQVFVSDAAAKTTTFASSAVQLGATSSSNRLYAALHVLAASGTSPTLDVIVRSDNNSGMATPTTQITFTQATAVTKELLSAAGPITDDWIDVDCTIGGTGPSFTFVVVVGIATSQL